jgi:hypothetical protein
MSLGSSMDKVSQIFETMKILQRLRSQRSTIILFSVETGTKNQLWQFIYFWPSAKYINYTFRVLLEAPTVGCACGECPFFNVRIFPQVVEPNSVVRRIYHECRRI